MLYLTTYCSVCILPRHANINVFVTVSFAVVSFALLPAFTIIISIHPLF